MTQKIVLVIVVLVSIWAHVWLFLWMKFKMDEGAVIRCLKDSDSDLSTQAIAERIHMNNSRVEKVCLRSKELKQTERDRWCLT